MKLLRCACMVLPVFLAPACSTSTEPQESMQVGQAAPAPAENPSPVTAPRTVTPPAQSGSASPEAVVVYFKEGEAQLDSSAQPLIDYTARLFREGNPFVMTV